jgi:hypothetical protein
MERNRALIQKVIAFETTRHRQSKAMFEVRKPGVRSVASTSLLLAQAVLAGVAGPY